MQSKNPVNTLLIWIIVLIVIVNVIVLIVSISKRGTVSESSYGMIFTQPVYSISGKVTAVNNKSISVEYMPTVNSVLVNGKQPVVKAYTFDVTLSDKGSITKTTPAIPYAYKNPPILSNQNKMTFSNVNIGDIVSVSTLKDLRLLSANKIEATSIMVSDPIHTLTGEVQSVNGNTITVKGISMSQTGAGPAVGAAPAINKTYTVNTDSNTELSKPPGVGTVRPEQIKVSDIKSKDHVTVYYQQGSSETTVTALLIQDIPMLAVAPLPKVSPTVVLPLKK